MNGFTTSKIKEEINKRIMAGNRTCLTSRLLSIATKNSLYKTLTRPAVYYGTETCTLLEADINKLRISEEL